MSITTRSPLRVAGANINSGFPNTGEQAQCRGGMTTATVYSGGALSPGSGFLPTGAAQTADHVLLCPGPGRLNNVLVHSAVLTLSGVKLDFYDAAAVSASGPATHVPARRVIARFNEPGGQSGQLTSPNSIFAVDMPFTSGLCVAATSGTAGFTASWTPETNPVLG